MTKPRPANVLSRELTRILVEVAVALKLDPRGARLAVMLALADAAPEIEVIRSRLAVSACSFDMDIATAAEAALCAIDSQPAQRREVA